MARNIFRTAGIGVLAVAGLMLLFFVLKIILFFLVVGAIVRLGMRYAWHKRAGYYPAAPWQGGQEGSSPFGNPNAEPLFGQSFRGHQYGQFGYDQQGPKPAIIEVR